MIKSHFELGEGLYLLNHSVGRLPVDTPDYVQTHFFEPWRTGSPDPWGQWMQVFDTFQQALATLFNSQPQQFCPQVNLSSGLSKLLGAFTSPGQKKVILMTENDFPSMGFAAEYALPEGYQVRFIPKHLDILDMDVWHQYMTKDVYTVFITHAHYNTGKLAPVQKVIELAHEQGVLAIVDIAQSSGVVPIDFSLWNADVVLGSCVKWLCGGPGAGFIWFNAAMVGKLAPKDVGWFSHKNPFEFNIRHFEYADDAARFWGGTPSVMPYVVATHGINTLLDIGIQPIREHNQSITQRIVDSLDQTVVVSPVNQEQRGGTLVLKFQQQDEVVKALQHQKVKFDVRASGMRLSPHIYTDKSETDTLLDVFTQFN
ncbi:aminotransferase class V-fold PLP-dependent enzyme [Candidatus Sororendozoicomonas aggregata]|uniref:aminotransferase class V-fold PLP-dependent enzyme n=1 Tax=Candidatus Sororendozoicomonas aggregata TaxID=3073239 RepID=UPI002ED58193